MKNSMKNLKLKLRLSALTVAMIWTCGASSQGTESASNQFKGSNGAYALVPVLSDLPSSWALAHSPNGDIWISHREGGLSIFNQGEDVEHPSTQALNTIDFVPEDLLTGGQGGLLDIAFHPNYADNAWVYLSYSAGSSDKNALKIVRFNIENQQVTNIQPIFEVQNKKDTPVHYGGRMAFLKDNALLVTTGDGFDYREQAQVVDNQLGKILRMTDAGEAHPSNPYFDKGEGPAQYVYSLGHRNPQGLLVTNEQSIVAHEHGPAGGDEINLIQAGENYGWPVITNGKDYIGSTISPFTEYPGMQQPDLDWTPSIAPSGMIYYIESDETNGKNTLKDLHQHLLVTSLKFQQIYAVEFYGETIGAQRTLLAEPQTRLRDIESDQQGNVWVLGDGEPATLYKLTAQ